MTLAVEENEAPGPEQVLLLGSVTVVERSKLAADLVEETGLGVHANLLPAPIDALISWCSITNKGLRGAQSSYAVESSQFVRRKNGNSAD
jgi:hypothetical protein